MTSELRSLIFTAEQFELARGAVRDASTLRRGHHETWSELRSDGLPAAGGVRFVDGEPADRHFVRWKPGALWNQVTYDRRDECAGRVFTPTYAASFVADNRTTTTRYKTSAPRFRWRREGRVNTELLVRLPAAFPLIAPTFPAAAWRTECQTTTVLGRPAERMHAWREGEPQTDGSRRTVDTMAWPGFDAYEFVRDTDYGFLLQFTAFADGFVRRHMTLRQVHINVPIADEAPRLTRDWSQREFWTYSVDFE
jgi:hypothetical protein